MQQINNLHRFINQCLYLFSDESSSGDMSDEDEILDKLEQELSDLGDSDDWINSTFQTSQIYSRPWTLSCLDDMIFNEKSIQPNMCENAFAT